jgi:hypothetical protein
MLRLRRALGRIAIVWLVCQAATLTLVPTAFSSGSAGIHLVECTCSHGDHATCPMHHKPAPDSKLCLMRSANDSGIAVLSWLLNGVGLVPSTTHGAVAASQPARVFFDVTTASLRPAPPDPPPPRA